MVMMTQVQNITISLIGHVCVGGGVARRVHNAAVNNVSSNGSINHGNAMQVS